MSSTEEEIDNKTAVELLKDKKVFKTYSYNNIETIYKAVKDDHPFTLTDFNNFISAAINGGSNSFITLCSSEINFSDDAEITKGPKKAAAKYGHKGYGKSPLNKKFRITEYFFTKFSPTDKQMKQITNCYKKTTNYRTNYAWLDVLIKRDYKFNELQKTMIGDIKYPHIHKLFDKNEMKIEIIKHYANLINTDNCSRYSAIPKEIEKMNNYEGTLPFEYLKEFFNLLKCNFDNDLIIAVINKSEMNESIYSMIQTKTKCNHKIVHALFEIQKPPVEFVTWLCSKSFITSHIYLLFKAIEHGITITEEMINSIITESSFCQYDTEIDFDFNNINIDFDKLMSLSCNSDDDDDDVSQESSDSIISSSDESSEEEEYHHRRPPTRKSRMGKKPTKKPQKTNIISINTVDLFQLLNIKPSYNTLKIICQTGYCKTLKKFITAYPSLVPTKECLDLSMKTVNLKMINELLCYKLTPDLETFNSLVISNNHYKETQKIVETMIKHGLQITVKEIEKLFAIKAELENLERFGIQYDEQLYFLCNKYGYFPDEYTKNFTIDGDVITLRNMCQKHQTKLDALLTYVKNKNLQFDQYCVDYVFIHGNYALKQYFRSLGCKPTILALIRTSTLYHEADYELLDALPVTCEMMCKKFDNEPKQDY